AEYRTYSDNVRNFEYDDNTNKDTSNNKADENDTDNSIELNASKAENNDKTIIEENGKMNKVEKCISDDEVLTKIDNTNEIPTDRKLKDKCEIWMKKVEKLRNTVIDEFKKIIKNDISKMKKKNTYLNDYRKLRSPAEKGKIVMLENGIRNEITVKDRKKKTFERHLSSTEGSNSDGRHNLGY
ncbi:12401_t:CDS:2, partial [Dentiscutata heterogama]